MKRRLLLLSDLWGIKKSDWLSHYTKALQPAFDLNYYDSAVLGEIDTTPFTQEHLHQQFVQGGIAKAVENLREKEKYPVDILAFSVGGVIAWKFGQQSKLLNTLTCVSSTRLRKETTQPSGKIKLYFGDQDEFAPNAVWYASMELDYEMIPHKGHQLYREPEFAQRLSQKIINTTQATSG